MSREMEKITVYRCKWCRKTFKRPDRHLCKFDPERRNCLSCRHNCGCRKGEREFDGYIPSRIICPFHIEQDGWDGPNSFPDAKGDGRCEHYEILDYYVGSSSFAAHRSDVELGNVTDTQEFRYDIFADEVFTGSYDTKEEAEMVVRKMNSIIENGGMYGANVSIRRRRKFESVYANGCDGKKRKEFE